MLIQCYICFSIAESSGAEDSPDRQAAFFAELISQRGSIWHFFFVMLQRMQGGKPRAKAPSSPPKNAGMSVKIKAAISSQVKPCTL